MKKIHRKESEGMSFNSSHSWLHRIKARANLHNITFKGREVSTDRGAWELLKCFKKLLMKVQITQAGFKCDEARLQLRRCQTKLKSVKRKC